jgi:TetR/AcrR family transcriptional regulator, mexJK operon transcriptional repressor
VNAVPIDRPLAMTRPMLKRDAAPAPEAEISGTTPSTIAAVFMLAVDDADEAADDLVSLWEGRVPKKIAFGLTELSTPEEIRRRAIRGTEVFLRAYRI